MINKLILKTLIVSLVFGGATVVFAEDDNGTANTTSGGDIRVETDDVNRTTQANIELKKKHELELKRARAEAELKAKAGLRDVKADLKTHNEADRKEADDKIKSLRVTASTTIQKRNEEAKNKLEERREEVKTGIQEKRVEIANKKIDNRFSQMNRRFQATIERLQGIMARVVARIEKIKNAGGNTKPAEDYVANAKSSLDLAKAGLEKLKNASEKTITLENASSTRAEGKKSLEELRNISKEIEKNLQDTRVYLEKAVGSLKGLSQLHTTSTSDVKKDDNR